jgi:hypothetical protein
MSVTNGDNVADLVSLKDRFPLIKTWVLAKQVNQSSIKNYGLTKPSSPSIERVQDKFTKCLVGVQILQRNYITPGGSYDIKDGPSIKEVINLTDQVISWPDRLVELEVWSNLAVLACKAGQTENLRYSHSKALETLSYFEKKKNENR